MKIEFQIELDDNGQVSINSAQPSVDQNAPRQAQLPHAYVAPANVGQTVANPVEPPINPAQQVASAQAPARENRGGSPPIPDPGTGNPGPAMIASGSGLVFVLGPIVICGTGPSHTGPGGSAPIPDPGTGAPSSGQGKKP
jgi:hypothetical protein